MRPPSRQRGVTLVELVIAMAVTLIVIAGVVVGARAQQKAYLDGQRLRSAQASGRRALLAFERVLPNAGFALDAPLAFDLSGWTSGPCPPAVGTCEVDSVAGPDELVFFARDPWYWVPSNDEEDPFGNAWRIKSVDGSNVTVWARAGDVFRKGQIFSAVCSGSSMYTFFTASKTVIVEKDGTQAIPLEPTVEENPFLRQDYATLPVTKTENCFNPKIDPTTSAPPKHPARLFLVNRYRFHVHPAEIGTFGSAKLYDPLLVLDRGVDRDGDGDVDDSDQELLAEGIESFQVAYGFYSASIGVAGATAGTTISFAAGNPTSFSTAADEVTTTLFPGTPAPAAGESPYARSSFLGFTFGPPPANERTTNHQGNIQFVRISVLARSLEVDPQASTNAAGMLPLLNQNDLPAWVSAYSSTLGGRDGYQRVTFETTITLPNMSFRAIPYF